MHTGTLPSKDTEESPSSESKGPLSIVNPLRWASRWFPTNPPKRQALNLILVAVVLPALLLSVALATFFNSLNAYSLIPPADFQQIDLALGGVLENQATTLAAIAADPVFSSTTLERESAIRRLEQFHQAHTEFESLALVNASGGVEATAGILHQDFYLWQNTPAYYDSLNNRERISISPLKVGVLSLDSNGDVDISDSHIERLVFTAPTQNKATNNDDISLVAGIMRTHSLMESAYQLATQYSPAESQEIASLEYSQEPDSKIQLLSTTSEELSPANRASGQSDSPDGANSDSGAISPFQESESSWYSVLPSAAPQQVEGHADNSLTVALVTLSVSLILVAGWVIIKSPKEAKLQPSVSTPEYTQPNTRSLTIDSSSPAQRMSQRLVAVQESVRREMADYLHGHVQSKLLALSMSLGSCQKILAQDPDQASHMLEEIQTELQKVQDEDLRQVSRELYPAIIKMGLVPAMRSLISRFNDSLEIDLIIDADVFALDSAGEAGIPEKQRLGVYRVAEEALSNVMKHAQANHIEVTLIYKEPDVLSLSIVDDGCGFDPYDCLNSQGLTLITDYAEAINGHAEISSMPERGTTITLSVHLSQQEAAAL